MALICEEGLENVMKRHQICALKLYEGLHKLGLQPYIEDVKKRLPTVTTVKVPDGINWLDVTSYAMKTLVFYLVSINVFEIKPSFEEKVTLCSK